jgi:hypothetical protein
MNSADPLERTVTPLTRRSALRFSAAAALQGVRPIPGTGFKLRAKRRYQPVTLLRYLRVTNMSRGG